MFLPWMKHSTISYILTTSQTFLINAWAKRSAHLLTTMPAGGDVSLCCLNSTTTSFLSHPTQIVMKLGWMYSSSCPWYVSMTWRPYPHRGPQCDSQTAKRNTELFSAGWPHMINDLKLRPGWRVSWVSATHISPDQWPSLSGVPQQLSRLTSTTPNFEQDALQIGPGPLFFSFIFMGWYHFASLALISSDNSQSNFSYV